MADPAGALPSGIASISRSIPVAGLDLGLRVRRGLVSGAVVREVFSRALVVAGTWEQTSSWTTIASAPTDGPPPLVPLPPDGPVQIVSSSPLDTLAGTGAQVFEVVGPAPGGAANYDDQTAPWIRASVPLNGTTPVQTTGTSFWGGMVEFGYATSGGSTYRNQGTITVTRVSDGKVLLVIPPTWGNALTGRITVPFGWVAIVRAQVLTWDGDTQAHWRLAQHLHQYGIRHAEQGGSLQRENSGFEHNFRGGHLIPGGTTFWWEAVRDAGGAVASPYFGVFSPVEFYRE